MHKIRISSSSHGKAYTILSILALISLSLYIIDIGNYKISLAFFICLLFLIESFKNLRVPLAYLLTPMIILTFFIANAFINTQTDLNEFFKSFSLTSIFFICYFMSMSGNNILSKIDYKLFIVTSTVLVFSFELFQVLDFILTGNTSSWFVLDSFSISTADDIGRFQSVNYLNYYRPISFYYEPSFLGLVLLLLLIINDYTCKIFYIKLMTIIGIVLTVSSTIIIFTFIYLLLNNFHAKVKSNRKFLFIFVFFMMLVFLLLSNTVHSLFDAMRLNELTMRGTSGHSRIILPLELVYQNLSNNLTGVPLGNSEIIFDNSFFLIFLYFGILTLPLLIIFFLFINAKLKSNQIFYTYATFLFALLFTNGAVFTPESTFLMLLINSIFFVRKI